MKTLLSVVGVGAGLLLPLASQATLNIQVGDTVTIDGDIDTQLADTGYISYSGTGGLDFANAHVYAGAFKVSATDSGPSGGGSSTIYTFCTDVDAEWIANTPITYTALSFTALGAKGVDPSWSSDPFAIENAAWIYDNEFAGKMLDANQAAGIQLAIWKVLYDTGTGHNLESLSTGNFTASGFEANTMSDAVGYLTDLVNAGTITPATTTWLDPSVKDQGLIWTPETPTNNIAVPEPATVLAGVLLLLPLGTSAFRIIRNRKTSAV